MNTNDVLTKLIAEIQRRREKCADIAADERNEEVAEYYRGKEVAYDETSSLITSLQQEQPEVELNEETLREEFHTIDRQCFNEGIDGWQREKLIARHFYELGLNARKK